MMGLVIVKGCAGLGNRILTAASAVEYAKATKRRLWIDWSDGVFGPKGENAFPDIFELQDFSELSLTKQVVDDQLRNCKTTVYPRTPPEHRFLTLYELAVNEPGIAFGHIVPARWRVSMRGRMSFLGGYWRIKSHEKDRAKKTLSSTVYSIFSGRNSMPYGSKNSLKRKEDVVFFADFCPMDGLRHVPKFRPSARLERQISEFVDYHQLSRAAVGVHVRATDKIPPLGFDKLLIKCRSLSLAGEQIFLSTDSSEVESIFKKEFPSLVSLTKNLDGDLKVGLHHRTAATADPDRIQEMADSAIIDMWSLSRCKRLLYQGNSTFSVIARALHKEHAECHDWLTL